ncbi:oxidoreductase [Arachidicoccus ginsenosidimutans]|uniref:SDR family oxidoreductase n=1 Tax=Arachidicoccus sp. BS20 TaxID=1850526 RepID=UPI0007F07B5D|nr:SDR family oxidoreductase [Arachidicoccus sp. BS20]ANI88361.1 oxidoreductase [Arachidicoccus sp. BS20]
MELKNKTALITGASSGIGNATAMKLSEAGVKVGLAARRTDKLEILKKQIEEKGGEAIVVEMNVADTVSVQNGVKAFINNFGRIDILFNNAGVMPVSNIDQFKTEEWNTMIDVNIKGVLNVTGTVLPYMIQQQSGHIFNTSSIAGRKVFGPGYTVYSATKFFVSSFSEGLRMEISKKHNIRVTSIQPGGVLTELMEQTTDPDKKTEMLAYRNSIKFLEPTDIADALLYAVTAPTHVNVAEIFILPTEQI